MTKTCTAKEISVSNAPAAGVWQAFTRPEMVKQYLFGTEMTADWRVGGAMTYRGQWQGKAYEDKPENYSTVTNELAEAQGRTTLTVTQDNNPSQESAEHSAKNWALVLDGLKKLLEK